MISKIYKSYRFEYNMIKDFIKRNNDFIISILFFSKITANVVGIANTDIFGLIFIAIALISGMIFIYLKKRMYLISWSL